MQRLRVQCLNFRRVFAFCLFLLLELISARGEAQPGFWTLRTPELPPPVKEAARSVFRVITQGSQNVTILEKLTPHEIAAFLAKTPVTERVWKEVQIEHCVKFKIEPCLIFGITSQATAFVFQDPHKAVTNWHTFADVFQYLYQYKKIKTQTDLQTTFRDLLLFTFIRSDKRDVVDGTKDAVRLSAFTDDLQVYSNATSLNRDYFEDIVQLHLPRELAPALQMTKTESVPGAPLYLISYPQFTTSRAQVQAPDSDGKTVRVSVGRHLSYAEWSHKTRMQKSIQMQRTLEDNVIFADFDCEPGGSGGPVVNEKGEVVAIYTHKYYRANDLLGVATACQNIKIQKLFDLEKKPAL